MPLRLIFMGTPDFAVPTLAALHAAGHEIVAVYTQPPRPAGRRGLELTPSPVQREAERLSIEVRTPLSLKALRAAVKLRTAAVSDALAALITQGRAARTAEGYAITPPDAHSRFRFPPPLTLAGTGIRNPESWRLDSPPSPPDVRMWPA